LEKTTSDSSAHTLLNRDKLEKVVWDALNMQEKSGYRGKDVSDVLASNIYAYFLPRSTRSFPAKVVYYFLDKLHKQYGDRLRSIFDLNSNNQYPQAHALIIRGMVKLYEVNPTVSLKTKIKSMAEDLIEMRNKNFKNHGWGQPFDWPSTHILKANTPRATVSSQAGMAFLDLYEIFGEQEYLEIAESVCNLFLHDFNYVPDEDGDFCFSYTTEDQYHIHNASTLAAAVLSRTYFHTRKEEYHTASTKAFRFTSKDQNADGSWNYRAKPDKVTGMVDNIHTGFVLDSFIDAKHYWIGDFPFEKELRTGMKFYLENFISSKYEPKYRPDRVYPVDIQSCAQMLLTLILYQRHVEKSEVNKNFTDNILDYTLKNFYNEDGRFYYRIYPNRIDTNSYIRWGDAWMIRAISEFLYSRSND
jgi:hypothetical protein